MSEPLRIDESDRYDRLREIPWWQQERLKNARVLVVGAGAIGNEVLKNLALAGVGTIHIVDQDSIETSNLTRSILFSPSDVGKKKAAVAAASVRRILPDGHVIATDGDIQQEVGLGDFAESDLVLACVDNRLARLWINRCCWRVGTPWIDAGVQEIDGVVQAFAARSNVCYECGFKEIDYQLLEQRYPCLEAEMTAGRERPIPTSPTIASIIGGLQSQWAIQWLQGMTIPWGEAVVFNGWQNSLYRTTLPGNPDCLSHESNSVLGTLSIDVHRTSARELLLAVQREWPNSDQASTFLLDREWIPHASCQSCGTKRRVSLSPRMAKGKDLTCPHCGNREFPEIIHRVDLNSPLADLPLASLGIPPRDWVRILIGEQVFAIHLKDP